MGTRRFIAYPEGAIYSENPEQNINAKVVKKTLWGDSVDILNESSNSFQKINCRGADGWIAKKHLQDNQILEINFIDVGQGDGIFIVTPDNNNILIDSGAGDNMYNFLSWRFNLRTDPVVTVPIENVIITHSDLDHYGGFRYLFDSQRFTFTNVYHNGLMERPGSDSLGKIQTTNGIKYLTEIFESRNEVKTFLDIQTNRGRMAYPNMMYNALNRGIIKTDFLSKGSIIPGYDKTDKMHFDVLAPVPFVNPVDNKKWLVYFDSNEGKAKNGNSIVMMLNIGNVRILVGGDLNEYSERYLINHYTGIDPLSADEIGKKKMIKLGREVFGCDVAKSCHHGSHHFLDDFLKVLYPSATVISSGDNESYTHPRPETLGSIGKSSKGERPLIFSTELARSAKDKIEIKEKDLEMLSKLKLSLTTVSDPAELKLLKAQREQLKSRMERAIAVYGMINLRTDGKKIILAQKKEEKSSGFEIFKLEPDSNGVLKYVS